MGSGERIRQEYLQKSYEAVGTTARIVADDIVFGRGNSRYRFVVGSMGLDRDPAISDQRIPPCLPAGRYKIFSGIPDEFYKVRSCN